MGLYDDPYELKRRPEDITGGQQLPATPSPQNDLATQMATLIANMQSSPGGGTVTVNQPSALQTVQNMQAGQTAGQALRTPVRTTTAPVNTIDQNTTPDPMAELAKSIGTSLNQPVTLPTVPRKPSDMAADYQLEQRKATDQYYSNLNAEDQRNNATIAANRVGQEFPGQDPAAFPEGLSKTLEGGRTFKALPSGGYSSARTAAGQDAIVAARKANYEKNIAGTTAGQETARRTALLGQVNPLDYGTRAAPPTSALEALASRGTGPAVKPATRTAATRPVSAARPTDAMSNPAILRSIIASNRYDAGVRQRARQRLQQLTQ